MKKSYIILLSLFLLVVTACENNIFDSDNSIPEPPSVTGNLKEAPFNFGVAVNVGTLKSNEKYRQAIVDHFNQITCENAMKMNVISLRKGQYNFADADYIVDFAQQNNIKVHGHTLLWFKHTPDWIKNYQGDSTAFVTIMREYIHDVVSHYKGKVISWDVVNEVLNDKGEVYVKDGTKENIWMQKIGIDYIALAFQFAHEADPDALLFYNEYGHEYSYTRRVGVNQLVKSLKEKNVPIHGIGMQMHTHTNRTTQDLRNAILTLAASTKLKIHVSELDIALNNENKIKPADVTDSLKTVLFEKQKVWYREVSKAVNSLPKEQQFALSLWGVSDNNTSVSSSPDWPLILDNQYEAKPAYEGLLQGFKLNN